jgi:omega-amidase
MKVVAVQFNIVWEDPAANWARVRALLDASPVDAGSLIVLPEMFDTGFSMNVQHTAQNADRASESFLRELAAVTNCAVLGGVVGPLEGGLASNEAVAFDPNGRELVRYRKQQPFTPSGEAKVCRAGERHAMFRWDDGWISPFICYDLRFPELFRPAARDGAELLVVMANWPARRSEHWVRLLQARAIENQAFVVGVNRCGEDPKLTYDGRSAAFDALGRNVWELDAREQVEQVEIDLAAVREWRREFPALQDMRR